MPWYQRRLAVFAASVALPPLGLILIWVRSSKILWKVLGTLAIAVLTFGHLRLFWGLRVENDGRGIPVIFSFKDPKRHEKELEVSRAAMHSAPEAAQPGAGALPPPEPVRAEAGVAAKRVAAEPAAIPPPTDPEWGDYRGRGRTGIYAKPIAASWPAGGLKPLWKQPVGGGYASFAIAEGLAFTIEQRRDEEVVAAYDIKTGRERWTVSWPGHFSESMGGDGPRTTPVYNEGRVYALGAEGEFRCLEAQTGKVFWRTNILKENGASNLMWAQAASPLIVDGKVITLPGGPAGKSVVAYDKRTGKVVWTSQNNEQSYTAPMLVTLAGRRQILTVSATRAMGLDPQNGELLWDYPWVTEYHINAAQPIVTEPDRFFISAGYGHGAAVVEIKPEGSKFKASTVWQNTKMKNKFSSSVLYNNHIYGLDESILACINAATGEQVWKGGRYGFGQLILAGSHLIVVTEQGELVLVKADPGSHREVARFEAISGKTWNNLAISDGILLVRNSTEMAAFRVGP
ncbi:MAG: PQQ-like beta-propeller repeat protein [Bryobacterales bacterium]|nr:PQQ-like beta-propeller repeat protein [Bryobacterales bacterium]